MSHYLNPTLFSRISAELAGKTTQMDKSFPHFPQFNYFFFQLIGYLLEELIVFDRNLSVHGSLPSTSND
jgi:hypothetical protein